MKITFLGTSGANAYPEAFCTCPNCEQARKEGGRSLRKRSSLLVNDDLLVDLGPDIMSACQTHSLSLVNVKYCLQTHPHSDHLDVSHFLSRSPLLGVRNAPCLNFYASPETLNFTHEAFIHDVWPDGMHTAEQQSTFNCKLFPLRAFRPEKIGDYTVTAFHANHAPGLGAYLYAIEQENFAIFYGSDTGEFPADTWLALQESKIKFDLAILEHTKGINGYFDFHLNAGQLIQHFTRMQREGMLKSNARVIATHIAHDCNPTHSSLVEYGTKHGYEIAYDGLEVELSNQ